MKRSTPLKPAGDSAFATFCQWIWDLLAGGKFPFGDTETIKHSWENGVHYFNAKIPPAAAGGATLQITGEWDPNRVYKFMEVAIISMGSNAGTFVYINQTASAGHAPYAGGGWWMQLPMGQLGTWL